MDPINSLTKPGTWEKFFFIFYFLPVVGQPFPLRKIPNKLGGGSIIVFWLLFLFFIQCSWSLPCSLHTLNFPFSTSFISNTLSLSLSLVWTSASLSPRQPQHYLHLFKHFSIFRRHNLRCRYVQFLQIQKTLSFAKNLHSIQFIWKQFDELETNI